MQNFLNFNFKTPLQISPIKTNFYISLIINFHFFKLSDGWTTNDLIFMWKEGDPVQVVKNLHLPRFTLETYRTDYCNSKTNTGNFYIGFNGIVI